MRFLTPSDLAPFADIAPAKAAAMIEDAEAVAVRVAPCLLDATDPGMIAAARAIVRGAVLRWDEAGSGAVQSQTAGPFGQTVDTRQARRGMFWPSEVSDLQALCSGPQSGAFVVDTAPGAGESHAQFCSLVFGAAFCSCGSEINGLNGPLWEVAE